MYSTIDDGTSATACLRGDAASPECHSATDHPDGPRIGCPEYWSVRSTSRCALYVQFEFETSITCSRCESDSIVGIC